MVIIMLSSSVEYILYILLTLATVIFVRYRTNRFMNKLDLGISPLNLAKKLTIVFYASTLAICFAGWWVVQYFEQKEYIKYEELAKGYTTLLASGFLNLEDYYFDNDTVRSRGTLEQVTEWQNQFPEISSIYTLKKRADGSIHAILPNDDSDHSSIIEGEENTVLNRAFNGLFSMQQKPDGGQVHAFVPVFDAAGKVDAVVSVGYDAAKYMEDLQQGRMKGYGYLLVFFSITLLMYVLFFRLKVERYQFQRYKRELEISRNRLQHLSEVTMEGILIHSEGKILEVNKAACKLLGYEMEELSGMPTSRIVAPESWKEIERNIDREGIFEILASKKDGTVFPVELLRKKYNYDSKIVNVTVFRDITRRKKNEEKIYHMAFHDDLTNLPNRNFIHQILSEQISQASHSQKQLAVMFLEINGLKIVNDFYGYNIGDQLMLEVVAQLKNFIGDEGILGRWSGNELIIIFPDVKEQDSIKECAEQLTKLFEKPVFINGQEFFVNARIGISLYPRDGQETKLLIRNADIARYQLDKKSTNQFLFFNKQMDEIIYEKMELEREIRKALDSQQFELYYQPQIELQTGKIVGLEALIRWNHPEKGTIPPSKFIPIAEDTRLIIPINQWVVEKACRQTKELLEHYPDLSVSVNVSPFEFESKGFIHTIVDVLEKTNLPPHCLDLEITERMTMDIEKAISILNELKSIGVSISMDDFGTGYSSLSYLKRLPIDRLKIDRAFMRTIKEEEEAIISAIISLGHNIGVKVLAEGVETEEQAAYLCEEKCDEAQGYYYTRPLPYDELKRFLAEYNYAGVHHSV